MWWYPDEEYEDVKAEVEQDEAAVTGADSWLREYWPSK